ncbi:MAG TPA: HD domain-containing phosphohydrolase [Methylibium sp.]|nr:HD domain-containing phosphohydrolase [Methylibium sp.]
MQLDPAGSMLSRATILVVDDAPVDLTIMQSLLARDGHRVLAAGSGAQALRQIDAGPLPDLVLLDVRMPSMDGYQVLARLKAMPATAAVPVLFHTALDEAHDEAHGFALGAVDYIAKPSCPEVKLARVRAQLAQARRRACLAARALDLEAEVTCRRRESDALQSDGLGAIAHLAALRDDDTGAHCLRTRGYVAVLAAWLRLRPKHRALLTDDYVGLLVRSAPLHDIGKVGIPDHILLKPGKLDADEWAVMKTHTVIGARAIELAEREAAHAIPFLRIGKEIARSHHERWDGSGYPDRLAGEAIPLSARLMAVADVFDALISLRSYKSPMSHDQARRVILDGRGSHFDPDLVDAFEGCFDELVAVSRRYVDHPPVPA